MKKIVVLSGKGGTGKTTLSSALIRYFKAKAFADCDVDAPNLHILNSVNCEPVTSDFMGGKKAVIDSSLCVGCGSCFDKCRFDAIKYVDDKFIIDEPACEGCGVCSYICPQKAITMYDDKAGSIKLYKGDKTFSTAELKMGRGNSGKLVMDVKKALFDNTDSCDIAILDGSPGIGCPVIASLSGVNMAVVVTEPTLSGISDLKRVYKTISMCGVKCCVCVNKYDTNKDLSKEIEGWCNDNNIAFVGTIPYDKSASVAINNGVSIIESDCPAGLAIKKVCVNLDKIIGEL